MMTVIMYAEYAIEFKDHERFTALLKKRNEVLKQVKSLKSIKTYKQVYGGYGNAFIELWELESQSAIDEFMKEAYALDEYKEVVSELMSYFKPTGFTRRLWNEL